MDPNAYYENSNAVQDTPEQARARRERIRQAHEAQEQKDWVPEGRKGQKSRKKVPSGNRKFSSKMALKAGPEIPGQKYALVTFVSKFTPQRSDYDGLIIHEVFGDLEEAKSKLEFYSNWHQTDVSVVVIGRWVPWNPRDVNDEAITYRDKMLNETMIEYRKGVQNKNDIFTEEVITRTRKAYLEGKYVAGKLSDMKHYQGEEKDGPMGPHHWREGDLQLLKEIKREQEEFQKNKRVVQRPDDSEQKKITVAEDERSED